MTTDFDLPWLGPRITPEGDFLVMANPGRGQARLLLLPVTLDAATPASASAAEDATKRRLLGEVGYTTWSRIGPQDLCQLAPTAGTNHWLVVLYYLSRGVGHASLPTTAEVLKTLHDHFPADEIRRACIPANPPRPALNSPASQLCFAFGSCQYPPGLLDRPLAEASYARLAARCTSSSLPRPEALLLLGDQVYVDASAGLFDPKRADDLYELPHQDWLRMNPVRDVLRELPAYMMLDDHEINDNWEPVHPAAGGWRYDLGRDAYWRYQRAQNSPVPATLHYTVALSGFEFFMADTRTRRSHRHPGNLQDEATSILDRATEPESNPVPDPLSAQPQAVALEEWLLAHQGSNRPLFITSASAVLPRQTCAVTDVLRQDGWDGYPSSLHRLLGFIAYNNIRHVVFLSGDLHLTCWTQASLACGGNKVTVTSLHCSGFYAPLPFANAKTADFSASDTFDFAYNSPQGPLLCRCTANTQFAPLGDGYGVVEVKQQGGDWLLDFSFDGRTSSGQAIVFQALSLSL